MTASTHWILPALQSLVLDGSYPVVKLGVSSDQARNIGSSAEDGEALRAVVATSAPTTTANDLTLRRLARTCMPARPPRRLRLRPIVDERRTRVNGPNGWSCSRCGLVMRWPLQPSR